MSVDKVYLKQLEKFGIESTRVIQGDSNKKRQEEYRRAMHGAVKSIMDTPQGRHWMYHKLDICGVFTAPIVPGDEYGTHVLCGVQAVGQLLLNDIMVASPEQFYLMVQEETLRKMGAASQAEESQKKK